MRDSISQCHWLCALKCSPFIHCNRIKFPSRMIAAIHLTPYGECAYTKLSAATSSEWANGQSNYNFMLAKNCYYNIAAFVRHTLAVYRIKLAISAIWQWISVYLSKLVRRRTINGVKFTAFKFERTVHALSPLPKILNGQWALECGARFSVVLCFVRRCHNKLIAVMLTLMNFVYDFRSQMWAMRRDRMRPPHAVFDCLASMRNDFCSP